MEIAGAHVLEDLLEMLACESPSILHKPEPLVLRFATSPDPLLVPAVAERLRTVPTVTILVGDPHIVPSQLVASADLCLTPTPLVPRSARPPIPKQAPAAQSWVCAPLDPVAAAIAAQPEAALALVALLRSARLGSIWDRLVAEAATYAMLLGSSGFRAWRARTPVAKRTPAGGPVVRLSRSGDIVHIELDRPTLHNAIDSALRDELVGALSLPFVDELVTQIHISGRGPSFCSGGDLDEFGAVGNPATAFAVRLSRHPGYAVHQVAERTTARLHGRCIGAGVEIPAFAARVIADRATTFRLPELAMGLVPGAGGTVSVTSRVGRHRAAWLFLTGTTIGTTLALDWGLVDAVTD